MLDKVQKSNDLAAVSIRPLVVVLHSHYLERQRLLAQNDRLQAQLGESQRRSGELQQKLDALAEVETRLQLSPLPVTASESPVRSVRMSSGAPTARVLIIDDDQDLLRLLALRLAAWGLRVSTAVSAEQGLALIAVEAPQLVISDIRLPGKDGIALFDEVRGSHRRCR